MMRTSLFSLKPYLASVLCWLVAQPAQAQWLQDVNLELGVLASDNATLLSPAETPIEDASATLSLRYNAWYQTRLTAFDVEAQGAFTHWLDESFESDFRGQAQLLAKFDASPNRLGWLLADYLSETVDDLRQARNPDTRQRSNYLLTGPYVTWPLNATTTLDARVLVGLEQRRELSASAGQTLPSLTDQDAQRLRGRVGLVQRFAAGRDLAFYAESERLDVELFSEQGIERTAFYAQWQTEQRQHLFRLALGQNSLSDAEQEQRAVFARLLFEQSLSRFTRLDFGAEQAYSDVSSLALSDLQRNVIDDPRRALSDTFLARSAYVRWRNQASEGEFALRGLWRELENEPLGQSRTERSVDLSYSHDLGDFSSLELGWLFRRDSEGLTRAEDERWLASVGYRQALSRTTTVGLSLMRESRSDQANALNDYQETRLGLSVSWSPVTRLDRLDNEQRRRALRRLFE